MNKIETNLLKEISDIDGEIEGAYNIRKNGQGIERKVTEDVNIVTKTEKSGIDIYVRKNAKSALVHIPVIITESGIKDVVYNDFYIGENASAIIIAGCGIHNDHNHDSEHNGIHRFFLEKGANVKYIEKHYGEGDGKGKRILNPVTEIHLKEDATLEMESVQIKGVNFSIRTTKANIDQGANLVVSEKIMTHGEQLAETYFEVYLNGEDASSHVTSRSVATEKSKQKFISKVFGNTKSFAHVECDAIIKDNATVVAIPEITANHVDANLIHEAAIGKIAGEQLQKLMTLGLTEKEAEEQIISGFLK